MSGIDESREFKSINIALLTCSDRRTLAEDTSGDLLEERVKTAGHQVVQRVLLKDNLDEIAAQLKKWTEDSEIDAILTTGGTGVTGRDVMPEAFSKVVEKEIPGFGELFRYLSFRTIATSTVQSRATAGVANSTYLFSLPGSPGAVKQGWDEILLFQLDSRHRPCNFVELMPRLNEK